jgi:hypothetical protein
MFLTEFSGFEFPAIWNHNRLAPELLEAFQGQHYCTRDDASALRNPDFRGKVEGLTRRPSRELATPAP